MTSTPDRPASTSPPRPVTGKLSFRFAVVLALALLPLGIVSLLQTSSLQVEVQKRTEAALLGETLRAASSETGLIRASQGIVTALAQAILPIIDNPEACAQLMRNTSKQIPTATLVAYMPKSGMMTCSSSGKTYDFSNSDLFKSVRDAQAPNFVVNRHGPISGTSVLGISHPVFGTDADYMGYVVVSLPHSALTAVDQKNIVTNSDLGRLLSFWTFDQEGEVLTANNGLESVTSLLPRNRTLASLVGAPGNVFQDVSATGLQRTYAVVPLVDRQLYLMSSWNVDAPTLLQRYGIAPYLTPIVMWAVGLIVAAWAAEILVTRHIRVLNTSIGTFAHGDRRLQEINMRGAPVELKELSEAYLSMTESITLGEAQLEDSIHQKEVLLREVHHRVKNNLQLIASIMNMQMRKAIAPEAKVLLKGLQDRVMSLATIHRGLYQTSGLADVRADELFAEIVRQIIKLASGPDKRFDLRLDLDDLRMTPDQAVPLSLLLTEAMTNAMKYAGAAPGQSSRIEVRLKREGANRAALEIINSLRADGVGPVSLAAVDEMHTSTGLGAQLLMAFAQQVGGTLEQTSTDHEYCLMVRFELRQLVDAEHRSGQTDADEQSQPT